MKRTNVSWLTAIAAGVWAAKCMVGVPAIAGEGGGVQGGGGDAATEMRVNEIREDILEWIDQGGAKELKLPGDLSYDKYVSRMKKYLAQHAVVIASVTSNEEAATSDDELKVLVDGQPKTCRGFASRKKRKALKILCNVERFAQTRPADQYRLIHHEYAGLARTERNVGASSDYEISDQLTDFLVPETVLRLSVKRSGLAGLDMRFVNPIQKCRELYSDRDCLKFWMGSPKNEPGRKDNETRHLVAFSKEFEIQTTVVTQGDWVKLMGYNPSVLPRNHGSERCGYDGGPRMFQDGFAYCPSFPVQGVSPVEAQAFIDKLNAADDGYHYRLPTEAEWEYSERGGAETLFSFGLDPYQVELYTGNGALRYRPVTAARSNDFGIYGMHGSVYQMLEDLARGAEDVYALEDYCPKGKCPAVSIDPVSRKGDHRLYRGSQQGGCISGSYNIPGSCVYAPGLARSASRGWKIRLDDRSVDVGFRLVRTRK